MALYRFVVHLVISHGGAQLTVPVDEPVSPVNEAVGKEPEKRFPNSGATHRVHGEALALPVTGTAHLLLLADNATLVLVLPAPDTLNEGFAADVVASLSLEFEEPFLHHGLRCDAGVVGTGLPEGVVAPHAVPPDEQVPA